MLCISLIGIKHRSQKNSVRPMKRRLFFGITGRSPQRTAEYRLMNWLTGSACQNRFAIEYMLAVIIAKELPQRQAQSTLLVQSVRDTLSSAFPRHPASPSDILLHRRITHRHTADPFPCIADLLHRASVAIEEVREVITVHPYLVIPVFLGFVKNKL